MMSRIIKVEVGVISWSPRLRLITLTETLIILDITCTKTESNSFIILWRQNRIHVFASSLMASNIKCGLDMITVRNHALQSYTTQLPVTIVPLTWLLYNLQRVDITGTDLNIHCKLLANQKRKEIVHSMFNKLYPVSVSKNVEIAQGIYW